MTVESQEKKKRVSCKRFFKYLGLGLLALMLTTSIVFQASWKVITIFAVILAGCTLLPKPARKWFWLSVGVVVIALVIWVFLPEDDEGWRPYTFDEELAALEAGYAIPDEENAAVIYNELFEILDIDANQPDFFLKLKPSSKDGPWLSMDHPETAKWLKSHQKTIETLLQAAKKEQCIFLPISADPVTFAKYLERLPKMRQCAFLLLSAANNDVAEGRIDDALEKYLCVIQMANHHYQQPAALDHLVGFAIERWALAQLNRFIIEGEPTVEQLQNLSNSKKDLGNHWGSNFVRILEYEKLFAKNSLCNWVYEVSPKGYVRLCRDPITALSATYPDTPTLTYSQRKLHNARTILGWFFLPSTPQNAAKMIDASNERYYAMAEPGFDWAKQPKEFESLLTRSDLNLLWFNYKYLAQLTADMSEKIYFYVHDLYVRTLALRRGSTLLIEIKRYRTENGGWPASLNVIKSRVPAEALIEPVSGNEFEYENHGERFSLYGETRNIWPK